MGKEFEKLAEGYKRKCSKCKKVSYIPARYTQCLECIAVDMNFESWETVCLQCGEKTKNLKGGNKFCWDCIRANMEKFREAFFATLSDEQKASFQQYENWSNAWSSVIILD